MKTKIKIFIYVFFTACLMLACVVVFFICCKNNALKSKDSYNSYNDLAYFNNDKVCLMSKETNKCITPRVDEILSEHYKDSLAIFINDNKRGYLNVYNGKIVIPADKFDYAWDFDRESGLAAVVENNKMGFINLKGEYFIYPQYGYDCNAYEFTDFKFAQGFCLVPDAKTGKVGLINKDKKLILPVIYDEISDADERYHYIILNGLTGLADSLFNIVLQPVYQSVIINNQGVIISEYESERQYMLAFDMKTVLTEYAFDSVEKLYKKTYVENDDDVCDDEYTYEETGYSKFYINGNVGVIDDKTGKVIIKAVWTGIEYHAPGIFLAALDEMYFLIDTKGKILN